MKKIWCVGEDGVIVSGFSGTWQIEKSNNGNSLRSVCIDDQLESIWCVGHRGTVLTRPLMSTKWRVVNIQTESTLLDIHMTTPKSGYIVGESGLILKTDDGKNWTNIATVPIWLRSITINEQIWIGGHDGLLMSSADGKTWIRHDIASNNEVTKIRFINNDMGWLCGTNGLTRKTLDGGKTWISEYVNVSEKIVTDARNNRIVTEQREIFALQCPGLYQNGLTFDKYLAPLVAAGNGKIYKTQPMGQENGITWQEINISTQAGRYSHDTLEGIAIQDNIGVAVGAHGFIAISKDGGNSWQKEQISVTKSRLYSVCMASL